MKSINWTKEIFKLIFYIGSVVLLFILGKVVFDNTHYSSALIGVSGGFLGILIFQLIRMINFKRNPENYHKERIDFKDERNNMIISSAKSSAYDAEISTFLHHDYTYYSNFRCSDKKCNHSFKVPKLINVKLPSSEFKPQNFSFKGMRHIEFTSNNIYYKLYYTI